MRPFLALLSLLSFFTLQGQAQNVPQCCYDATCFYCWDVDECQNQIGDLSIPEGAVAGGAFNCGIDMPNQCSSFTENAYYGADEGCMTVCGDSTACNYDPVLGPAHPDYNYNCYYGCADPESCNYDPWCDGTNEDACDYSCIGCTYSEYLEFNPEATVDNGSCTYPIIENCVSPTHAGYTYDVVQIGNACWFAENAKYLPAVSPGDVGSEDDAGTPHAYVYGYEGIDTDDAKAYLGRYDTYGVLYNHFAAYEWPVCPSGWHVAWAEDWIQLELALGLPDSLAVTGAGFSGSDIGTQVKDSALWNGTNSSGFSLLGAGYRETNGNFHSLDYSTHLRGFIPYQIIPPNGSAWSASLNHPGVIRDFTFINKGFSVRCVLGEEIAGCFDPDFAEYDSLAVLDDGSCLSPLLGCMDSLACNFMPSALTDDGSCDFSCCPGPGCCAEADQWDPVLQQCICTLPDPIMVTDTITVFIPSCGEGTIWDPINEECIIATPADLNFDGCVTVSDLLLLLTVHGTCPPLPEWPDSPGDANWQCNDPIEYQGYDYATVQIGDQCWFAENLRSEHYNNGDFIPSNLPDSIWSTTNQGATAVYGDGSSTVIWGSGDEELNLLEYGRLYNWHACSDDRNLCPSGWHVSNTADFDDLSSWAANSGIDSLAVRLRDTETWANNAISTDELEFGWKAGGNKISEGAYNNLHLYGEIMLRNCPCWAELKYSSIEGFEVENLYGGANMAASVRCVKD